MSESVYQANLINNAVVNNQETSRDVIVLTKTVPQTYVGATTVPVTFNSVQINKAYTTMYPSTNSFTITKSGTFQINAVILIGALSQGVQLTSNMSIAVNNVAQHTITHVESDTDSINLSISDNLNLVVGDVVTITYNGSEDVLLFGAVDPYTAFFRVVNLQ